jgi:hypothetical protein
MGRCSTILVPYLYWLDDRPLVVPNAPATICDMCHEIVYEPQFVQTLHLLLDDGAGLDEEEHARPPQPTSSATTGYRYRRSA